MNNGFFAMLNGLKYINRWALMRNTQNENLSDHSVQVAFIAHALALIGNEKLNKNYNADRVSTLAMYHDVTEILTGDMPTPIKYKNETLKKAYKDVEKEAAQRLLKMLPDYLVKSYDNILMPSDADKKLMSLVKAADKICAYIKCIDEKKAGNREFLSAENENLKQIKNLNCEEADIFMEDFINAFNLNLDELTSF
ncbi:MAG: 5'-deoxynucleotidase [Oscillospiraceae bacterium]|nr:5'-deoxynucleotidase [Oscillospiraceae bacterium]